MPRRLISTGSPFEKTAGYSRAVIDGDFAFVAGTTGYDYATMTMPADVTSQSRNCFKTIEAALKEGGFAMADIVRATYYITDLADADAHLRGLRRSSRRDPPGHNASGRRGPLQARDEDRDRSDRQAAHRLIPPRICQPATSRRNHPMSPASQIYAKITGPIVMVGFGSIGKGTLPMIERHLDYDKSRITVIDPKDEGRKAHCEKHNVRFIQKGVTRDNYRELLTPLLTEGGGQGFCVNLSVDTGSTDIMELCNELGALYIDTVNEPWLGFYFDSSKGPEARSNYALREATLAAKKARPAGSTTAVSCCGANPGMVSFFVKQALLNVAADLKLNAPKPKTKAEWADLMRQAGIKGIHIAERDTQRSKSPKEPDVFVNTWSVEGFLSEGVQPSELGWGTHEKWMPENARTHEAGCGAAIYLMQPGANTRVRTWCPTRGAQYGFLVTHNEFDLDLRLLHGA